jgi:hypothetical protein
MYRISVAPDVLWIEDHLYQACAITKVNKHKAAVVAPPVYPSGERHN